MRQFGTHRVLQKPTAEFAFNGDVGAVDLNHLLLLAIERALAPPVVHSRSVFQPMRIVVVDPALFAQRKCHDESEMPKVLPRALQPAANIPNRGAEFHQRAVRGEILSDENGRLYEKLGRQIRPIHQLASDQFGDVIDLVPAHSVTRGMITPPQGPKKVERPVPARTQPAPAENPSGKVDSKKSEFSSLQPIPGKQKESIAHRKLFADPGQWRVICWGEFKEILARQLAHPERLRDTYRLPCYVQVLEIERPISNQELAAVYKSDREHHTSLYFLTDEITAKLGLVLPLRPVPSRHTRSDPNTLLPNERVFRLLAANDPTIDVTISATKPPSSGTRTETPDGSAKSSDGASSSVRLLDTIPNRFVKEWDFKLTREEATYDMNEQASFLRNFGRRLRVIARGNDFRKWQTLLAGRSVDEQLWAVRPPAGLLADSRVREWARKSLAQAGYDSQKMITEWEIFWRMRGL